MKLTQQFLEQLDREALRAARSVWKMTRREG